MRQRNDSLLNPELKRKAISYFPNFFGKDCNILVNRTPLELQNEYLCYCKKYFESRVNYSLSDREDILNSYQYIKKILEKREEVFQAKSLIIQEIMNAYDRLIAEIANYGFCPHRPKSYGAIQNRVNRQILLEISFLAPLAVMIFENFDFYLKNISIVDKVTVFAISLKEKLDEVNQELELSYQSLKDARHKYHESWDIVNRGHWCGSKPCFRELTKRDLGIYKKEWRLARNDACSTILYFYKQIKELNQFLSNEEVVNNVDKIEFLYHQGIMNIEQGPNYYNYLTDEEREVITQENILKKERSRKS